jgi:hypothetical protein
MPGDISYKQKYLELRAKYMADVDTAFRVGMEQGMQQAQNDQAAQQQAAQQQADQMAAQGGGGDQFGGGQEGGAQPGQDPTQPGADASAGGGQPDQQGSELDSHIAELESMVNQPGADAGGQIQKSLQKLKAFRKSQLLQLEFKKSEQAIKAIGKVFKKPEFKMGQRAEHNLSPNAKQAVTMQHKIVSDIMQKMEAEEKKAGASIQDILNIEGITKA